MKVVCNKGVFKAHGSVGRQVGRYQAVQGATTEAGFGRFKGRRVKTVTTLRAYVATLEAILEATLRQSLLPEHP